MYKNLIRFLAVSLLLCSIPAWADVPAYRLIKEKSRLKFFAIQNGAPVEGRFEDFTAEIHFDPDNLDQSRIVVEVATGSAVTTNDDVTNNVKLPDWLSSEAFPKATFKSKKISRMPMSDNYYSDGELTLRGKTMPVVINFIMELFDGKNAIAKGYVTLRRSDFGVGQGDWARDDVIKDEVRVEFRVAAQKK